MQYYTIKNLIEYFDAPYREALKSWTFQCTININDFAYFDDIEIHHRNSVPMEIITSKIGDVARLSTKQSSTR